jgi:hypothetical protein
LEKLTQPSFQPMNNVSTLWANPHLRYALIGVAALQIAEVWIPAYKSQIDATRGIIMFYAIAAAANSTPTPPSSGHPDNNPVGPKQT